MEHKVSVKATRKMLKNTDVVNDEYFIRQLARDMVTGMPLDELKKLMTFTITDAYSEEGERAMNNLQTPDWKIERLHMLRQENLVLYEAECNLPEKQES